MIIGVTGTLGAGKGSVVDYLVDQKGFAHLSVTDFMRSVAQERGITPTRMVFHDIANEYRARGPIALQEAVRDWGKEQGITDNFVIEAQHTPDEVRFVQGLGGVVIAVDADIRTRYERIVNRGHDKDNTTFEEFKAHEELEMSPTASSTNNLGESLKIADVLIENNGSVEELHAAVDALLKR